MCVVPFLYLQSKLLSLKTHEQMHMLDPSQRVRSRALQRRVVWYSNRALRSLSISPFWANPVPAFLFGSELAGEGRDPSGELP